MSESPATALEYGPQTEQVKALIERARHLTPDEETALDAAWDTVLDAARDASWRAALYTAGLAAGLAARFAVWDAAVDAVWRAARDAAWDAALYTAGLAARALVVRDLIGQYGFTQEDYDLLTKPWRNTIGPIHPDDQEVTDE